MARCSVPAALCVGGWFGLFALAWGASPNADVGDGSFSVALCRRCRLSPFLLSACRCWSRRFRACYGANATGIIFLE